MIIISACLAGVNCKYTGGNNYNDDIVKLVREGKAILVCPEQLGGLTTPRLPSEIINDDEGKIRVVNNKGQDVTEQFMKGGIETLRIAKKVNSKNAILKANSPSCGYGQIYDGTFTGKLKKGNGITVDILLQNGIKVYSEKNFKDLFEDEEKGENKK